MPMMTPSSVRIVARSSSHGLPSPPSLPPVVFFFLGSLARSLFPPFLDLFLDPCLSRQQPLAGQARSFPSVR